MGKLGNGNVFVLTQTISKQFGCNDIFFFKNHNLSNRQ